MDFPLEFVERTRLLLGDEEWKKLEAALAGEPSVSIRVNRKKIRWSACRCSACALVQGRILSAFASGLYF